MAAIDQKARYRRQSALCYDIAATMASGRAASVLHLGDAYAALALNPDGLPRNVTAEPERQIQVLCRRCSARMQLAHSQFRTNLPDILAFWCEWCGYALIWQGETGRPEGQSSVGPTVESAWITRYIAVSFRRGKVDFTPGRIVELPDAELAIRRAELMIRERDVTGSVAFSRRWNPGSGEFDAGLLLEIFGEISQSLDIA